MPPTLFPPACLPDIFTYCDCFWIIMIFEQGLSKASDSYNPWQGNCGAFTTSEESSSYCISAGQETRNTDTKQLFPSVCVWVFFLNHRSLNELRVLLLESHRHSRDMDKDLSREVHKAEWKVKEQKLQDDIKTLREKLLLLVRTKHRGMIGQH